MKHLATLSLLFCSIAAHAQTESEPNDNIGQANALPAVATTSGDIGCANPGGTSPDYFAITTPGDGTVNFTIPVNNVGAPGSLQFQVFNSGGGLLVNATINSGSTGTYAMECAAAGLYYVQLYRNTSDCYTYSITWSLTQPGIANDAEPNENMIDALPLPQNTPAEGHVNFLYYANNLDYYEITTVDDGRITLSFEAYALGAGGANGAQLQFFNNGGGLLHNWSEDVGSNSVAAQSEYIIDCQAAGTYYLSIYSNGPCGVAYCVSYAFTDALFTNDTEPNNTIAQADGNPVLQPNTNTFGHVNFLSYADNDDYYRINSPDQGIITFTVIVESQAPATATGLQVQLFNDGGGLLENWSTAVGGEADADTSVISTYCRGTGAYYLRLFSNIPCGVSYRVSFTGTAPLYANDVENNDDPAQADTVDYGVATEGRLAFYYDDNNDYYAITPPDQGVIHIHLAAENVAAGDVTGMQVQLFNSGGGLLENWSAPVGGNSTIDTITLSTACRGDGLYYVRFYTNAPCGVSYRWYYDGTGPLYGDDIEDNDNVNQAQPVAYNTGTDGRLAFYYDDNDDYYAITPSDQGVIRIHLSAENVAGADATGIQVQLFNNGGGLLENWSAPVGGNSATDTITLSTICRGAGLYYVRFYTNSPCGVSYRWSWDGIGPVYGNDVEDNDNAGQAQPLAYDTDSDGRLAFYYDDGDDYRVIEPADDGFMHLYWNAENVGAGDPVGAQLQLFNSGGGLIGNWSVPVGGASTPASTQIDFPCVSDGLYYVRCYPNNSCGISYRIRYDVGPPLFGPDPEPNNDLLQAPPIDLDEAGQDGRLSFYYEDNNDYYACISSGVQPMQVITLAENVGAPGTMQLQIFNSGGGLLYNASHDVGGGGIAASDTSVFGPFDPGTCYLRLFSNGACGVSYRILCNDDDGDGECNGLETAIPGPIGASLQVIASPNPSADGSFMIRAIQGSIARIDVFAANGQCVSRMNQAPADQVLLDLSHAPGGIYIAHMWDAHGRNSVLRLVRSE